VSQSDASLVTDRPVLGRALRPLSAFVGVVVVGIAGFAALGDVGLVEATFWMVDITSVELHFRSHDGPERATKTFAVLVKVALVLSTLWTAETVLTAAFGGQIQEELKRVQDRRSIEDVEDHVIICGYGMFGRTVAQRLRDAGREVVVVERDDTEFAAVERDDFLGVQGDARQEDRLQRAGVERAAALVAAIDDSNTNIQTAIVASQLAPDLRVVVRVGDEMYESLARRAGADEVVIPEVASGQQVGDLL
jgi:voltage-gated potassium channel